MIQASPVTRSELATSKLVFKKSVWLVDERAFFELNKRVLPNSVFKGGNKRESGDVKSGECRGTRKFLVWINSKKLSTFLSNQKDQKDLDNMRVEAASWLIVTGLACIKLTLI